ncbi:hypothetical protein [Planktothricoides raciborskii]|uniref:Transposase n=1 Tax=Planktothricoides raciborskii FACHB-1370 TaxID=2949576 RepID=A0ABR8E849_9CYAN|nr:hypothetical protein [Planktothricoides raciborskii]MBD2543004.1 hypothetical protein [Planktothricoides raciborskii FACHB-1370]MBD2581883.1 hypothetical protein [Planktothricoides raciborskii FACHB-1261]
MKSSVGFNRLALLAREFIPWRLMWFIHLKNAVRNRVSILMLVGWERLSQETRFRRRRNRGKKPGFYDIGLLVAKVI